MTRIDRLRGSVVLVCVVVAAATAGSAVAQPSPDQAPSTRSASRITAPPWPPLSYPSYTSIVAWKPKTHVVCAAADPDNYCGQFLFVARFGCPGGLEATVNWYGGGAILGATKAALQSVLPARTPVLLKFDTNIKATTGEVARVRCLA
jgi:hypothetical protein